MPWKLLDMYCAGGGASMGYHKAGFKVTGIDIEKQPRYPFDFIQGDVLKFGPGFLKNFDVIHASPPCLFASILTPTKYKSNHANLIPQTRAILQKSGVPYVIENVPGAKKYLRSPLMLCGTMFNLNLWRHRFFEINPKIPPPIKACIHDRAPVLVSGTTRRLVCGKRREFSAEECRVAMETDWMRRIDMDVAIPPAYTEWIGKELISILKK